MGTLAASARSGSSCRCSWRKIPGSASGRGAEAQAVRSKGTLAGGRGCGIGVRGVAVVRSSWLRAPSSPIYGPVPSPAGPTAVGAAHTHATAPATRPRSM